jgi:hypothetical protein
VVVIQHVGLVQSLALPLQDGRSTAEQGG